MLRRILAAWLVANFLIVGTVSWLAGGWYLGWQSSPAIIVLAELGLIMVPNLLIPVLIIGYWCPEGVGDWRKAFGWQWMGITVLGEETMFRGWIQTQIGNRSAQPAFCRAGRAP